MDDYRPIIAHGIKPYLPITSSWIYHQLRYAERYRPIVLSWGEPENLEIFPFEPIYSFEDIAAPKALLQPEYWWIWPEKLRKWLFRDGLYPYHFYHILRRLEVALLHGHFGPVGVRLLPFKRRLGVPLVTTFYGYDLSLANNPFMQRRYRELFAVGERFLVEGSYMKSTLAKLGCPEDKIIIQHIGVDLSRLPFIPRKWFPGEPIKLLIASSFREKKGIPYALQAFAQAYAQRKDLVLRIIGDGPLRPQIERQIADLGIAEAVTLLGYQPYPVFLAEICACHILVAASVTASDGDTEGGSPVSITEAQATGMPVLATTHADIPEVVQHGDTGLLAPERDVDALAQNLAWLVSHPELWPGMGEKARAHIEREYNLSRQIARLEQIYDSLLEQRRGK